VFEYIDAQAYSDIEAITNMQIQSIGTFLATLHQHSAQFKLPTNFIRPKLDWEGLFGKRSPYQSDDEEKTFTTHQKEVLDEVAEKVRAVMEQLGETSDVFGLVHGDFIAKNILIDDDAVCVIDFDDCGFGYYLYDFAPLLLQFSNSPRYEMVKELFWQAYTITRPLPENHRNYLEAFVAGRHVASCRWIAGNLQNPTVRERAPKILQDRTEELQNFLLTGKLERRSETI
jgi:Ser/Thr protein kinase RdoA (MazF antagonist)